MKKAGIIALVLVLLASFVSGQYVEDFTVASEQVLQTYQGTPADSHFAVTNTGNVASGYSLSVVASDAASWLKAAPLSFSLEPGQTRIVLLHLDIPRDAEPGTYELQTVFTTVFGTSTVLEQDVRVDVPQNIELQSVPDKTVLPCGSASYPITVLNTGAFPEEYALTVSKNVADDATFSDAAPVIGAGANKTVTLTLKPEDCSLSGEIPFTVSGEAASTEQRAELELKLSVDNTFIPAIDAKNVRVGSGEASFDVSITNTGSGKATYSLALEGADFLTLAANTAAVDAGETATIAIDSKPGADTVQQKYDITLKATVQGVAYPASFVLTLKDPTWAETHWWVILLIAIALLVAIIIAAIAYSKWVAYTKTPEYQAAQAEKARIAAELASQREAERQERESQKAKERAEREKQREEARKAREAEREAIRKAKEEARLEARIAKERAQAAKEAQRELKATNLLISKEALQGDATVRKGKSFWWVALIILILAIAVVGYGFRTYLLANVQATVIGAIALVVVIILITLYAAFFGSRKAVQEWTALKPRRENQFETGWKHGLGQLWLRVKELVPTVRMTLIGTRKNPAFATPDGIVYQYITIMPEGLAADQVEKQRFMFRVSRRWLENHQISEGSVKLMRSTPDGWKGIGTEKVRSDEDWVYYGAQCVGFEPFAIVGKSRKEQPAAGLAPGWWFVILGIVAILAITGGIYYFATAGTQGTEIVGIAPPTFKGIPPQAWDEDTRLTIDLSQHFTDPDGDRLTYTYTPIDDIVVKLSGNTATLIPKKDWHGEATITFTASDGKGGKVSSNAVSLFVRDMPEPTFWTNIYQGLRLYSLYIVAGIILLIVIIFAIEKRNKQ